MTESEIKEHNEKCRNQRIWDWVASGVNILDNWDCSSWMLEAIKKLRHLKPPTRMEVEERDFKIIWQMSPTWKVTLYVDHARPGCMLQMSSSKFHFGDDAIDELLEILPCLIPMRGVLGRVGLE